MKKLLTILFSGLLISLALTSCNKDKDVKWEYRSMVIAGDAFTDYHMNEFSLPDAQLNMLGKDGWELVTAYTILETVHPNFGNKEYVTGIQPNTRTKRIVYVLKRPLKEDNTKENEKPAE